VAGNHQPILLRKNVLEPDLELVENRFKLMQRKVVLSSFKPVQGGMRNANFLRKPLFGDR
jgi:hypothetical protein